MNMVSVVIITLFLIFQHIIGHLQNLGWAIEEDSFQDSTPYGTKNFTNIIATFQPEAKRKLTLACHFDSKYYENIRFIGATDSAVPCAMLLDLAKTLDIYLKAGSSPWVRKRKVKLCNLKRYGYLEKNTQL